MSCCCGGSGGGGGGGFIGYREKIDMFHLSWRNRISDFTYLEKSSTAENVVSGVRVATMKMRYEGPEKSIYGAESVQKDECKQCKSSICSCK
ncbi:hypothetical protein COLO4_27406 [Corchorus olitorius]|uniref:Uncharacterized protein n=1 Tax=Corchorus olitorius TaxID=93759 RepID=A0A1R3HRF4_9ROSI|nr:hypothetical protein COLO4_27406 [Corchorus olitorius]